MSVKMGLLALLRSGPRGVYQLRQEFEACSGGGWKLNIGQAYATVQRLERDGLVAAAGTIPSTEQGRPDIDLYALTDAGLNLITTWWTTPVDESHTSKDELTIKIAAAALYDPTTADTIIDTQRRATLSRMQELTRAQRNIHPQRSGADSPSDTTDDPNNTRHHLDHIAALGNELAIERQLFLTEAQLRWLDHIHTCIHQEDLS